MGDRGKTGSRAFLRRFSRELTRVRIIYLLIFVLVCLIPFPHEIHAFYIEQVGTFGIESAFLGNIFFSHAITSVLYALTLTFNPYTFHVFIWGLVLPVFLYCSLVFFFTCLAAAGLPRFGPRFLSKPVFSFQPGFNRTVAKNLLLGIATCIIILLVIELVFAMSFPTKKISPDVAKELSSQIYCPFVAPVESDGRKVLRGFHFHHYVLTSPSKIIDSASGKNVEIRFNVSAGIKNVPNCKARKVGEDGTHLVDYVTNNHGFRMQKNVTRSKENISQRVMVMGDSFAFGAGMDQDETVSHYLNALTSDTTQVLNAGVQGFSSLQSYLMYNDTLQYWDPDIVLFFHYPNDINGNLEQRSDYEMPIFSLQDETLIRHAPIGKAIDRLGISSSTGPLVPYSHFVSFAEGVKNELLNLKRIMGDNPRHLSMFHVFNTKPPQSMIHALNVNCNYVLKPFYDLVLANNATFLLIYIPPHIELDEPYFKRTIRSYLDADPGEFDRLQGNAYIHVCAKKHGIPLLDLAEVFNSHRNVRPREWYNRPGGHWSPRATNVTAHSVKEWMMENGVLNAS